MHPTDENWEEETGNQENADWEEEEELDDDLLSEEEEVEEEFEEEEDDYQTGYKRGTNYLKEFLNMDDIDGEYNY